MARQYRSEEEGSMEKMKKKRRPTSKMSSQCAQLNDHDGRYLRQITCKLSRQESELPSAFPGQKKLAEINGTLETPRDYAPVHINIVRVKSKNAWRDSDLVQETLSKECVRVTASSVQGEQNTFLYSKAQGPKGNTICWYSGCSTDASSQAGQAKQGCT